MAMHNVGSQDVSSGFWQLALAEQCQVQFAVATDIGCDTPRRLIQGSLNGTGPFNQAMVNVLGDLLDKCVVCYVDDVVIVAPTGC